MTNEEMLLSALEFQLLTGNIQVGPDKHKGMGVVFLARERTYGNPHKGEPAVSHGRYILGNVYRSGPYFSSDSLLSTIHYAMTELVKK